MKLFYGSKTLVKIPVYGEGNPSNDYGLGFYMTDNIEMADLWASQFKNDGFSITYNVDFSGLKVLKLLGTDEKSILSWITILVKNRFDYVDRVQYSDVINWLIKHFDVPIDDYDVVIGYRADDSYFNYSRGFVNGEVSFETLSLALKLGKLGIQNVLVSKESFKHISYLEHKTVKASKEYETFRRKTLNEYHELLDKEDKINNTFIRDLMRKYGK